MRPWHSSLTTVLYSPLIPSVPALPGGATYALVAQAPTINAAAFSSSVLATIDQGSGFRWNLDDRYARYLVLELFMSSRLQMRKAGTARGGLFGCWGKIEMTTTVGSGQAFRMSFHAETQRLYLRGVLEEDTERNHRWMNDRSITRTLIKGAVPVSEAEQRQWVADSTKPDRVTLAICLKEEDIHIGNCGLSGIHWIDRSASVGLVVGETKFHGQGYGAEAMGALCRYAFDTLNFRRLYLTVLSGNLAARHIYRKLGFSEEGCLRQHRFRDGVYQDEHIMGLFREELVAPTMSNGRQAPIST